MKRLKTLQQLFDHFGKAIDLSRALGVSEWVVYRFKRNGIPPDYWLKLTKLGIHEDDIACIDKSIKKHYIPGSTNPSYQRRTTTTKSR